MAQVIQIRRRVTGAGVPPSLEAGELAYNDTGHLLFIGDRNRTVQMLVSPARQVEVSGDQSIAGKKTIAVVDLKVTGGVAFNVLQTDGGGNLSWTPPTPPATPASNAEMDAGTRNDVFGTPLNTRSLIGASVATLATTSKTVVPAINELKAAVDALGTSAEFVGSFQADAGTISWTAASGGSGNSLPIAAPANNGWYLIADVAGSTPPSGAPAGTYQIGDWLISNGSAWSHLAFGGVPTVTASSVVVTPAVAGATDVQAALTAIDADNAAQDTLIAANAADNDAQDLLIAGKVNKGGDTMTGPLVLPANPPSLATHAANKQYVDDAVAAATGGLSVETDGISIVGDGLPANPLAVALVDGGVY